MRHEIRGRVLDQFTGDPLGGVRVEAWDKDFGLDDYLGSASTRSDGSFSISFDESAFRDIFFDNWPDLYFKVYCYDELLASTADSVLWNVKTPQVGVTIQARHPKSPSCGERHIYLKIERLHHYSPVLPADHVIAPAEYGRDCMRGHGHENGLIPPAEIEAREVPAVVYREYLDSGYLIPKPAKLIAADVNEPPYSHRVPGTVIYTRPCQRLEIHVWNTSAATPAWTPLPDLTFPRPQQFTATLLPDGRVFIAGGISGGPDGGACEIFDPSNPGAGWVAGPSMKYPRTYHSSFILLQDGSVLGGGAPPDANPPAVYTPHERFFPGYFDMLRPVISAAPATINYGGSFTINTPNQPP